MFMAPHLLWLAALPAGLAVAYVVAQRRRTGYAVRFTNLELLDDVAPDRPGWRRHVPAAALVLALVALVVALARPVRAEQVPVELATVVLALDTSISMDATDVAPSRLSAAQEAALVFLEQVPDQVRVGLVGFAETAVPLVAPTTDRRTVAAAIRTLALRPGTAIGEAILAGVSMLEADAAQAPPDARADTGTPPATIVVLSDGETTAGRPDGQGVAAAQRAEVPVSTISFGTVRGQIVYQGEVVPVPVNGQALAAIADQTGGQYFDADNAAQLTSVFSSLGSRVGFRTEDREIAGRFMAASLILGSAAAVGSLRWFSRLP